MLISVDSHTHFSGYCNCKLVTQEEHTMKQFFVIEVDDDGFTRVLAVEREYTETGVSYCRKANDNRLINTLEPNPKFYGQLDALLITPAKLAAAAPIVPAAAPDSASVPPTKIEADQIAFSIQLQKELEDMNQASTAEEGEAEEGAK
jgi:hypothetical protein